MRYQRVKVIGGKGPGAGQFAESLRGVALDPAGLIYAVGDRAVKIFDLQGNLRGGWQTERTPYCVALDAQSRVYVGEVGQVEKFDSSGNRLGVWRDDERLGLVTAVGFGGDYVFIADVRDRCIRRYDQNGKWLNNIGKENRTRGFLVPNGHLDFSLDGKGVVHAANPGKHRVERYSMDGELQGHFGRFGVRHPEGFPGCCNPTNLALTAKGHVVVTEKAGPRVKLYNPAGELLAVVAEEEFDVNCKNMDVATDAQGRIYVVDTVQLNIHVFEPIKEEGNDGAEVDPGGARP